jgi:hypothetical protein
MPTAPAAMLIPTMIIPAMIVITRTPHAPAKAEYEGKKRHNGKRRFFHMHNMVRRCGGNEG